MKTGSQPKISWQSSISFVGGLVVADVLDDPAVGAGLVALAGVVAQALQRAGAGADALDRGDLLFEREDRLDLQGAADPGPGAADAAAAAQVLESVDREPHLQRLAGLLGARRPRPRASAPASAAAAAPSAQSPMPPAAVRESTTWIRSPPLPSSISRWRACPAASKVPEMPAEMWTETTSLPRVEQRLVDGEEVADRRLRGGGAALGGAQALVELVVVGDLGLALLLAVDRDVEADRLDAPLGEQVGREVGRRVADDGGLSARVSRRRFSQTAAAEPPPPPLHLLNDRYALTQRSPSPTRQPRRSASCSVVRPRAPTRRSASPFAAAAAQASSTRSPSTSPRTTTTSSRSTASPSSSTRSACSSSSAPRWTTWKACKAPGFQVNNPNVVAACGCGSSFQVKEETLLRRRRRGRSNRASSGPDRLDRSRPARGDAAG